jgi:hypothetical protein
MHVPANIRLNRFTTRAITPVVLLGGLLLLAVFHFNGVLKITQAQDNLFHGVTAMSDGPLQVTFQRDAGTARPQLQWNGYELITYADWSSTVAIDGVVAELWNNPHGYTYDEARHRLFATTSGDSWQLIEVITLVDSQHVTVAYSFVARHEALAAPHTVTLAIQHFHTFWYRPQLAGTIFRAQVLPTAGADANQPAVPIGTLTLQAAGPALAPGGAQLGNVRSVAGPDGQQQDFASQLTTTYQLTDPLVDKLTPLGTETLTFAPSEAGAGTPVAAPVDSPIAQP